LSTHHAKVTGSESSELISRDEENRPAAAVIPAPMAYRKVAAVKKLVAEIRASG